MVAGAAGETKGEEHENVWSCFASIPFENCQECSLTRAHIHNTAGIQHRSLSRPSICVIVSDGRAAVNCYLFASLNSH